MRIWKIAPPKNLPKVSIIILNWNGGKETLLEKAFTEKCCVRIPGTEKKISIKQVWLRGYVFIISEV